MKKDIKLRGIRFGDFGLISRIIRKMNLREDLHNLFVAVDANSSATEKKLVEQKMQADLVMVLVEKYDHAEKDIQKLLSNLSGLSLKEVAELSFDDLSEFFKQIKEDENLPSFLKSALQ